MSKFDELRQAAGAGVSEDKATYAFLEKLVKGLPSYLEAPAEALHYIYVEDSHDNFKKGECFPIRPDMYFPAVKRSDHFSFAIGFTVNKERKPVLFFAAQKKGDTYEVMFRDHEDDDFKVSEHFLISVLEPDFAPIYEAIFQHLKSGLKN
jgi:hypothetical protein